MGDLRSVVNTSSSSTLYELQQNELSSLGRNERQSVVSGAQYFTKKTTGEVVGQPLAHKSAHIQATGEAVYCDDAAKPEGCLTQLWFLSTIAHGKIISVDSEALWKMFQAYSGIFPQKIFPSTDPIPSARLHTTRRFLPRNMSRALVKLSVLSSLKPER